MTLNQKLPVRKGTYYPFLDGFRAVAIIMILAHHIREAFTLDYLFVSNPPILKWIYFTSYNKFGINLTAPYKALQYLISDLKGVLGVEFFLVISGFLITGILMRREINSRNIGHFYKRRFFRIYPAYALMVVLSIGWYVLQGRESLLDGLKMGFYHLFLLQNYFGQHTLLAHTWTLVVLEQFYFFAPLIILAVCQITSQKQEQRQVLIWLCPVLMITGILVRFYYFNTGHPLIRWPVCSPIPYWTILSNLGPISFGCLLALLEPCWSVWKKNPWWGIFFWLVGMALFIYLFFGPDWSYFWGHRLLFTSGYLSVGFLFFAAYHGISFFARLKSFQWLGRHSYGIYVWHYLVLEFWKIWIGNLPPELIVVLCFASCIGVGVLSTKTLERYFLNMREKIAPSSW